MRIAIIGFGREGKSALAFLKRDTRYKGARIDILDKKKSKAYLSHLEQYDLIVKSPGVPYALPEIAEARKAGVLFTSATALFFGRAKGITIGVTGTKGKGTTAMLLYKILKACGKDAYIAGNIGVPMLSILPKLREGSVSVLELSSFQLEHLLFSPRVAIVLDIFPDHLDHHASFEEYIQAKRGIVENQARSDAVLYPADSAPAASVAQHSKGRIMPVYPETFTLFSKTDLKIPGGHNFINAVMAASAALYLQCDPKKVRRTALSFTGLPYRLQRVRRAGAVQFYNDSASTNPSALVAAICAFTTPTVVIAGGRDKGFTYEVLKNAVQNPALRHIIIAGENAHKLTEACAGADAIVAHSLEKAVRAAWRFVVKKKQNGEQWNIVFSPGAASFDQFENYKERGRRFNQLVKNLVQ